MVAVTARGPLRYGCETGLAEAIELNLPTSLTNNSGELGAILPS